jgi:hypothetical protein
MKIDGMTFPYIGESIKQKMKNQKNKIIRNKENIIIKMYGCSHNKSNKHLGKLNRIMVYNAYDSSCRDFSIRVILNEPATAKK